MWKPTDGDIELSTKRRSWKKRKLVHHQKRHVGLTLKNTTAEGKIKKKKKNTSEPMHDIGIKDSFVTNVLQLVPQEKSHTSEEKKDI